MSRPGPASGAARAALQQVVEAAEGCCSCDPREEKGPKVSSFRNGSPRPLLCQSGSLGSPRGNCPMRPGITQCCLQLGLGHEARVVPGLCQGAQPPSSLI